MQGLQDDLCGKHATETQSADDPTPQRNMLTREQRENFRFIRQTHGDTLQRSNEQTYCWRGAETCDRVYCLARKANFLQQIFRETQLFLVYEGKVGDPENLKK